MAATLTWYYQSDSGVVGPISSAELRRLVELGIVRPTTRIRRGEAGSWFPAEGIQVVLEPAPEAEATPARTDEPAEWYFSRQDKRKLGPVRRSVLVTMLNQGKLQPVDLVWKQGMAAWVPTSEVLGLLKMEGPPPPAGIEKAAGPPPLPGIEETGGPPPVVGVEAARQRGPTGLLSDRRILLAAVGAGVVLFGLIVTLAWIKLRPAPPSVADAVTPDPARMPRSRSSPPADDGERLFDDALAALRPGRTTTRRASWTSTRRDRMPRAARRRDLSREIELASSLDRANELVIGLSDEQLKSYLRMAGGSLGASDVQTPELRALHQRTLLQALRQESLRRQSSPGRAALPVQARQSSDQAKPPEPSPPPTVVTLSSSDRSRRAMEPVSARVPPPGSSSTAATTLEAILDAPGRFEEKAVIVNGLYKIGTRLSEVKSPDGNRLGWSLPVATSDGNTICTGVTKVTGRDTYLLLDDALAPILQNALGRLRFSSTLKPTHKCIITATARSLAIDGRQAPIVHVIGLEILGACDLLKIVNHQYNNAFTIIRITRKDAVVARGDGALWVDRLGGEERYVLPLRRKVQELKRQMITQRDQTILNRYLQVELGKVITMNAAAQQQQARMLAAMMGRLILP